MTEYLVTPSLYDNWRYYHLLDSKTKQDFLNTLLKVKEPPSKPMLAGIAFEDDIRAVAEGHMDPARMKECSRTNCVVEIANIVRGGLWQERVMHRMNVLGFNILLYGKADVLKRDWFFDIKWTSNGSRYEPGKYTKSIQHPSYMLCAKIPHFAYLISDGSSVWREDYHFDEDMDLQLRGDIASLLDSIMSDEDFKKAYLENWETLDGKQRNSGADAAA